MIGASIRQFFRQLFGSRIAEHVELELLRLRTDYAERFRYQDDIIANLREEKAALLAKVTLYENSLMPLASRAGAEIVAAQRPIKPNFKSFDFSNLPQVKSKWEQVQEEHEAALRAEEEAEKGKAAQAPQGTM